MTLEFQDKQSIPRAILKSAITQAVKLSGPDCESFVGVVIGREMPMSASQPNWEIRGVRFGKSDRKKAGDALATIIDRMQRDFNLSKTRS